MVYQNKNAYKKLPNQIWQFLYVLLDQIKNQLWQIINKYVVHQALNL